MLKSIRLAVVFMNIFNSRTRSPSLSPTSSVIVISQPVSAARVTKAEDCHTAAKLPQELFDIIIDFLFDDKPTLLNCSIVSPHWLASARLHLFRAVSVSYPLLSKKAHWKAKRYQILDVTDGAYSAFAPAELRFAEMVETFIDFLADSPLSFTGNIRELSIVGGKTSLHPSHGDYTSMSISCIYKMMQCLPTLCRLSVSKVDLLLERMPATIPSYPLKILELNLSDLCCDYCCILALLLIFPDLTELYWGVIPWGSSTSHLVAPNELIKEIGATSFGSKLTKLTVKNPNHPSAISLNTLLAAVLRPTTTVLSLLIFELDFNFRTSTTHIYQHVLQTFNNSVQTLVIIPSRACRMKGE